MLSLEKLCTFLLAKEKTWQCVFNTNSELLQNHTEKQNIAVCIVNPHFIVCLNVKELFGRRRRHIWSLSDRNEVRTHNHLVRKRTLNHLVKLLTNYSTKNNSKLAIYWYLMLFSDWLFWLKNCRFSTNSCKGFLYP